MKINNVEAYHIVITTHNSRISKRMIKYKVIKGPPLLLNLSDEIFITKIIGQIIIDDNYKCIAYNICKDHVHIILVCKPEKLINIIAKIKGYSSILYNRFLLTQGRNLKIHKNHLWSQKFFHANLDVWSVGTFSNRVGYVYKDSYFNNAINYINTNRQKHNLPLSSELQSIIDNFLVSQEIAFEIE